MARKRKGNPIHGWLVLDKPLGISSNQAVGKVRWLLQAQKVGHGGTLDPLATGVLPLAFGEATKTVSRVMDGRKAYRFTVKFGEATNTDDAEGEVCETSSHRPTDDEIKEVLAKYMGTIEQIPPAYSAIKVDGQRAYKLAREGEDVKLSARPVRIDSLQMVERPDADHASFEVECGKGTYVRSLGRDIARDLGTCSHIVALRRIHCGPFSESDAISLESLEDLGHSAALDELLPVKTVLDDIPALAVTGAEAEDLRMGRPLRRDDAPEGDMLVLCDDTEVCIANGRDGEIAPVRVFNL